MEIFGIRLTDRQNQTIAAAFCAGTLVSKLLFDRLVKPVVPDYRFSFLSSQTTVSLGLATYTTLKIMELAKLIPSVPLPFKVIGALSTFALLTSGLEKAIRPLKTAYDLHQRFSAMQQYCRSLKEEGKPFHCSIELIDPKNSKPYLIHVIYKPQKYETINLFLSDGDEMFLKDSYLLISSIETDSYTERLLTLYLKEVLEFNGPGILSTADLHPSKSVRINRQPLERKPF